MCWPPLRREVRRPLPAWPKIFHQKHATSSGWKMTWRKSKFPSSNRNSQKERTRTERHCTAQRVFSQSIPANGLLAQSLRASFRGKVKMETYLWTRVSSTNVQPPMVSQLNLNQCTFPLDHELCSFKKELKSIPHSTVGCPTADVEIDITGPSTEDMFLHKTGSLVCRIQVNNPSVDRIYWEDQNGHRMAGAILSPPKGKTGLFTLPLEITYDEWSSGIKRICVVEHANFFDRIEKEYERKIGKKKIFVSENLLHFRIISNGLIFFSFSQKNLLSVRLFSCCLQ